jgi:hypothetical protein
MTFELPEYARVVRTLECGLHPYRRLLPVFEKSPAVRRIATAALPIGPLLDAAVVEIAKGEGFCFVNVENPENPVIMLFESYYFQGNPLDLYLDLAHELTHLRQHAEGKELWDHELHYVDRPTEIEGYAVAVEEGIRLGMTEELVIRHLSNPWLSPAETARLRANIDKFLSQWHGAPL